MFEISMINVLDKLLQIVHNMEHSRSQLKTYISRISFSRGRLVLVLFCEWSWPSSSCSGSLLFNKYQFSSVQSKVQEVQVE